jgi:hypothetical protein
MTSLTALLSKWPLIRQIRERADRTGLSDVGYRTRESTTRKWPDRFASTAESATHFITTAVADKLS